MGYIATSNVMCHISAEQAWQKMRDISKAHEYVPGLRKTTITSSNKEGVGASRRVVGKHGALDETVTEWKEGKGFTIRLHKGDKGPSPFASAQFTYRIDPISDRQCKLTTSMVYELPWGVFGKLLNSLLFDRVVRGNIRDVVLCLKHYYESGKAVTDSDLKQLRQIPEETLPQPYQ
jgi:ribosome-associated toxin RatA of RatAB toxin-antitoxin module